MKKQEPKSVSRLTPSLPSKAKSSFTRVRPGTTYAQEEKTTPDTPKTPVSPVSPSSTTLHLDAGTEPRVLNRQFGRTLRPLSPKSVTEFQEKFYDSLLSPEIKPFYDMLRSRITDKLDILNGDLDVPAAEKDEIDRLCLEITLAISQFKTNLQNDPMTCCRTADNMTLWTHKRHLEIKSLQSKIKPHFDRINQLFNQEEYQVTSKKHLYSSSIGREAASKKGQILEATPFGEILESTSIHTTLKDCFGPNAFSRPPTINQNIYKEIHGQIIEMKQGSPEDLQTKQSTAFTTDIDTAVIIGVWEAVSSSYAQEAGDEAHIYVPFGIGANSVVWNHELPELRKNFADEHIIIHSLRSPETYMSLKNDYEEKQAELVKVQSIQNIPSEIVFLKLLLRNDAQKKMDDYLNEGGNRQKESLDKSNIDIITRDKTRVSFLQIRRCVKKLRSNKIEEKSDTQSNSQSTENKSDSFQND